MGEEECFVKPGSDWLPRLIVIDGCNIGRSACGLGREVVDCAGLMAVIRWLLVRDFDVVAFLPVVYNNSQNFNVVHVHLLTKLEELGLVTFTPARTGRGDRKAFINYDDLYVTTLAARHGGCVLSGDKFKDILAQPAYSEFHPVILQRTLDVKLHFLPYDVVHHKVDVFYKALPELFIHEDIATRAKMIAQKLFASPDDPEFSKIPFESGDNEIEDDFAHQINFIPNSGNSETAMNGIWTHTTSLNAAMDVRNNFILEESPESYSNIPSASSYQEELLPYAMNPYVMIPTTVSEISEDSTCVSSEAASSHGQSMDDISEHVDQATCTQEDILQEIMAHIDRLVDIRDRTNRKENDVKLSITSEQSSLSENSSDEPRQLNNIFLDDMTDDQSQRPDDIAEIAEMGRQPGHNSSEEEFSYNDNNHNEKQQQQTDRSRPGNQDHAYVGLSGQHR